MIQDIAPHRLINAWRQGARPRPDDLAFFFEGPSVRACLKNGVLTLPTVGACGACSWTYLFDLDGRACFLAGDGATPPEGFEPMRVRSLRGETAHPRALVFAVWTACQIANWMRDNRFCGRCGGPTTPAADERAIDCPACARRIYPRIIPAVIVGVLNRGRILLTRYRGRDIAYCALIAGFTEIGETLEETVAREVKEEVGLSVKNLRYYKSQPWGIVDDLLAGFFCEVDGPDEIILDTGELKEAFWAAPDEVELQPDDFSLTNEMMTVFKEGRL